MVKKIGSIVISGCLLMSLSGCNNADKSWVAEYNQTKINTGVYVQYLMSEYRQLYMQDMMGNLRLVEDELNDNDSTVSEATVSEAGNKGDNLIGKVESSDDEDSKKKEVSPLKKYIKDEDSGKWVNGEQWVIDKAKKDLEEEIAIESKFSQMGLTLNKETVSYLESNISKQWDALNEQQGYEKKGVSQESLIQVVMSQLKKDEIFRAYFGVNGIKEVKDEDVKEYLSDNYVQVKYHEFELYGLNDKEKQAKKELYDEFLKRAKDGEDIDKLIDEFDDREHNINDDDTPEKIENARSGYNKDNDDVDETVAVFKNDGSSREFSDNIQKAMIKANVDEVTGFEDDEVYIIFIRQDISKDDDYLKDHKSDLLNEMKGDEYNEEISTWIDKKQIKYNDKIIDGYTPSKLKIDK